MVAMGVYKDRFKYRRSQEPEQDPDTGFYSGGGPTEWIPGGECQAERAIPAIQYLGADGQMHAYSYDVFIPKPFRGKLAIADEIQVHFEDGSTDEFTIQGVDDLNRRYIEVWG